MKIYRPPHLIKNDTSLKNVNSISPSVRVSFCLLHGTKKCKAIVDVVIVTRPAVTLLLNTVMTRKLSFSILQAVYVSAFAVSKWV